MTGVSSARVNARFWQGRSVFVTGHTGFKGGWLSLALARLGARVTGYALLPETEPNLFNALRIDKHVQSVIGDLRDRSALSAVIERSRPEIVFHLAAQPLVRRAYFDPVETFDVNVMGTVYLMDALRATPQVQAVVIVTSDKVYDNKEWPWGYRETDRLGGKEPYGVSKACAELAVQAYRHSYFLQMQLGMATARAGNVIGGGDWAVDRLIPDAMRAWSQGAVLSIRNPMAVRPWQHVLEPIRGYLLLAERIAGGRHDGPWAWNFGPEHGDAQPVANVISRLADLWGGRRWEQISTDQPYEAHRLAVDSSLAIAELGWRPIWNLDEALVRTAAWYRSFYDKENLSSRTFHEIESSLHVA